MKILVVTGHSAGHIFPAVSFIQTLKEKFPDTSCLLVVPKKNSLPMDYFTGRDIQYITSAKLSFDTIGKTAESIIGLMRQFIQSANILFCYKPDVIIGFGSIVCIWFLILGWLCRINTVLHEQNVVPGRANRFLSYIVDTICVSFPETLDFFPKQKKNLLVTGNPIKRQIHHVSKQQALKYFGLDEKKFTILVMGGSQSSLAVNRMSLETFAYLRQKDALQVIHLCGSKEEAQIKDTYLKLGISASVFAFLKEMEFAYSIADLVFCRAGATTLTELCYYRIPAILFPYPFAGNHQYYNAELLSKKGCCKLVEERFFSAKQLAQFLEEVLTNKRILFQMSNAYPQLNVEKAAENLVATVLRREPL
ncbi:MAG: UDP-N-acetylglucosamine--N-acetylmuramyl-(pentapeptide) pyrophosphoryl-undecaprenol N-acetylglucosamine transferase [Candidatus Omnitrophica bacterium]|nr:UDP-N-acetylglucosamine--N-acetylmuramyl-(pentapeptide) pyrophosphoryl-undecaprenol N-acetylglucosamine transferase [Candidatus Omnitrophota bacterium]